MPKNLGAAEGSHTGGAPSCSSDFLLFPAGGGLQQRAVGQLPLLPLPGAAVAGRRRHGVRADGASLGRGLAALPARGVGFTL